MSNHRVPPTGWRARIEEAMPSPVDWKIYQAVFWTMLGSGLIRGYHAPHSTWDSVLFAVGVVSAIFAIRALMTAHAMMVRTGEY